MTLKTESSLQPLALASIQAESLEALRVWAGADSRCSPARLGPALDCAALLVWRVDVDFVAVIKMVGGFLTVMELSCESD